MTVLHQQLSVQYEYPVVFTRDVLARENPHLEQVLVRREPARRHRVFAVVDEAVWRLHPSLGLKLDAYVAARSSRLQVVAPPWVLEGGEPAKNRPDLVGQLVERFDALKLDRQAFVLGIGGGALLDVVGYAAAIAHRGLRHVRLPTTVLAQGDSGVGVKNGVNAFGKKNLLGTFMPPFAVLNDFDFLRTLSPRDRAAGLAEAVKVALVRDAAFFGWLEAHAERLRAGEEPALEEAVRRAATLHLTHIATGGDPFETGSSRPLDYGHWAAHKLESLTHNRLRHGEAVAIGMALDSCYAARCGLLHVEVAERVVGLLEALGLPVYDDALADDALLRGLEDFREHLGGELTITLLRDLGQGVDVHDVDEALVRRCIHELRARG